MQIKPQNGNNYHIIKQNKFQNYWSILQLAKLNDNNVQPSKYCTLQQFSSQKKHQLV